MKKDNLPLVSIVVPCYNHEKYVKTTIESIIQQTYENIELIIIDDGSSDKSVDIIKEMATLCKDRFHRFKFIHRENKGLCRTLNEGIDLAEGKYFCSLASDDIYIENKIKIQVEFLEKNNEYGMCYGKVLVFENSIKNTFDYNNSNKSGLIFNDLINDGCFIPAPSVLIKKEVFKIVGKYDESLWIEDWDMWLRIARKFKIGYIDKYFAYYRKHDSNISKQSYKMYEAQVKIFEKYKYLDNYEDIIRNRKIQWFTSLAKKHKRESIKYLPFSLKYLTSDIRVIKGIVKLLFSF